MEELDISLMKIISYSGECKTCCLEAIKDFRMENQEKGEELLKKAYENLLIAKKEHSVILQQYAKGSLSTLNLLMVHAEDQMMSSETIYYMTNELFKR